jgi:sporulation-control protein
MFKSILTRLGIGGATLDARLDRDALRVGERLTGTLHVNGGDGALTASKAELRLMTRVEHEEHASEVVVAGVNIPGPIRLEGEHRIPFSLDVPVHTPVTAYGGRVFVWLASELDVAMAVDPSDRDPLDVHPAPEQAAVIEAMDRLGFRLMKTDVEARGGWGGRGFVQEFEFRPVSHGRRRYDEVEIVFERLAPGRADLLVQLDRSARSLSGLLMEASGLDESWARISVNAASPETAAADLQRLLG